MSCFFRGALLGALATVSTVVSSADSTPPTFPQLVAALRPVTEAAATAQAAAARAGGRQAAAWDDPDVEIEAGRRAIDGDGESHVKLTVSQAIPLGGRRHAARTGEATALAVEAERDLARLALVSVLRRDVAEWQRAIRAAARAGEAQAAATELAQVVDRRLAANLASELERLRAQVEVAEADLALRAADAARDTARRALERRSGFTLPAVADIDLCLAPPPTRAEVATALEHHPGIVAAAQRVAAAQAGLAQAYAARRPDVTVGVFGERDGEATEVGLQCGLPIPLWNGNRAGATAAAADVRVVQAEAARSQRERLQVAEAAWDAWHLAQMRAQAVEQTLLPAADRALALVTAAFAAGSTDLTTVIDARRTRVRLASDRDQSLAEVTSTHITLDLTLGRGLEIAP